MRKRLSNNVRFRVVYTDETVFGSAITNRCDQTVRQFCQHITAYRQNHGLQAVINHSRTLLAESLQTGGLAELYAQPNQLRQDWLYPDPDQVNPAVLEIERADGTRLAQLELPAQIWANLGDYLGEWERGSTPPTDEISGALWSAFEQLGLLEDIYQTQTSNAIQQPTQQPQGVTLVGHSTVSFNHNHNHILVDPLLFPKSSNYPAEYQPLGLRDLGYPDAVFITHSHPDHFDLSTLLRLGADTPIYVPAVERESVLSIDMVLRLKQLGFTQVHAMHWFQKIQIGQMHVMALPFYGEQPTVGEVLNPEVRNQGNIYCVEMEGRRIALTADSGCDNRGDIKQLAATCLARYGKIDVLLGGYRGFGLYPIQYLFSSVSRYLPFVPQGSWRSRQQTMSNADDLLDTAEIWDAQQIVPYSDGGAPWYWQRGLGPNLDGSEAPIMAIDPPPDHVAQVARQRTGARLEGLMSSPVTVEILRPGDCLQFNNVASKDLAPDEPRNKIIRPHPWPYQQTAAMPTCVSV